MGANHKELEDTIFRREFLNLRSGCNFQIRLIGTPVRFYRVFSQSKSHVMVDGEETAKKLKQKYPEKISSYSERYYCWCIDREDERMKILDMPEPVATFFGERQLGHSSYNISGYDQGYDWKITTNGKSGREVRYRTVCVEKTPLSYDETIYVEAFASLYEDFKLYKTFSFYNYKQAEKKLFNV